MKRIAFIDEVALSRDFLTGDVVRQTGSRDLFLSPFVGRVLWSNPKTGKVQVQWPWGQESETPSELVRETFGDYIPPSIGGLGLQTWESFLHSEGADALDAYWAREGLRKKASSEAGSASRIVARYEAMTAPIWRAACHSWYSGRDEITAFKRLSADLGPEFGTDAVRVTVANVYELGRRLAIYWRDNNRKYRVTKKEKDSGVIVCPRCKGGMKPRTYRQGQRVLSCKSCGFSIHPEDLV